ncbi:MAG: translation initiation factor IF-2, partial [bacterium]|nr:translation initiation factor IF-2 [bacterium]
GITQHIGAYQVEINDKKIVFLDTPGHEAFTAMRARGASVTDIAILVVAADDGVMPQTIEAINHAKAAKVPIVVAVKKIDKPGANIDRIKQQLTEYEIVSEEWGGDTIFVEVSALKKIGIDLLLTSILTVAEVLELRANPNRKARGVVIEAQIDKGKGPIATVLVQRGTLNVGDAVVLGSAYVKVRTMLNDKGKRLKKAGPSTPVEIHGLSAAPLAGDELLVVEDDRKARALAQKTQDSRKAIEHKQNQRITLDDFYQQMKTGVTKELRLIIKGDVQGSVEAIKPSVERLSSSEVTVKVIHTGVGPVNESDIMLATASNAIVIGFNVRPEISARKAAEQEQVDMRFYRIIYEVLDDISAAMKGMLAPIFKEVVLGQAQVRVPMKITGIGVIAGSYVIEGKITRQSSVRLVRGGIIIFEGKISSLKRFKDDVKEVLTGYECGIGLESFDDLKEGDIVEAFIMEEVKR